MKADLSRFGTVLSVEIKPAVVDLFSKEPNASAGRRRELAVALGDVRLEGSIDTLFRKLRGKLKPLGGAVGVLAEMGAVDADLCLRFGAPAQLFLGLYVAAAERSPTSFAGALAKALINFGIDEVTNPRLQASRRWSERLPASAIRSGHTPVVPHE